MPYIAAAAVHNPVRVQEREAVPQHMEWRRSRQRGDSWTPPCRCLLLSLSGSSLRSLTLHGGSGDFVDSFVESAKDILAATLSQPKKLGTNVLGDCCESRDTGCIDQARLQTATCLRIWRRRLWRTSTTSP